MKTWTFKYREDQLRAPAGSPGSTGGEFVSEGGSSGASPAKPWKLSKVQPGGAVKLPSRVQNALKKRAKTYKDAVSEGGKHETLEDRAFENGFRDNDKETAVEQYNKACDAKAVEVVDDSHVYMRTPADSIDDILRQGVFKSHLEGAASTIGGEFSDSPFSHYARMREEFESNLFGWKPGERPPVYGYISQDGLNEGAKGNGYGDVIIKLNDNVRERTTVTAGDSLRPQSNDFMPLPFHAVDHRIFAPEDKPLNVTNLNSPGYDNVILSYFEAQVHGGLSINDVESITFENSRSTMTPEITELLKKRGFKQQESSLVFDEQSRKLVPTTVWSRGKKGKK